MGKACQVFNAEVSAMAAKTINSLFFKQDKKFLGMDKGVSNSTKELGWFAEMAREESLMADEIDVVLDELGNFIDQKEAEKEEAIAELQLAEAYKEVLVDRLVEVRSIKHGMK